MNPVWEEHLDGCLEKKWSFTFLFGVMKTGGDRYYMAGFF